MTTRWLGKVVLLLWLASSGIAGAARAPVQDRTRNPYLGAILVEAESGQPLFEDQADVSGYPASMVKMMNLLVILEQVQADRRSLDELVVITAEASRMGGSQVYLKEGEQFPLDDLLYAMMIQSANDAAVALAIHVAGSREAFVGLMRQKAAELGMSHTRFESVHGLPPGEGQRADVSTARDMAILARALCRLPEALRYTSARERPFRQGAFVMRTHNALLSSVEGCDGLKTGYFKAGGYSITATALRGNRRLVAVVLGSVDKAARDMKASELLTTGFARMPQVVPTPEPKIVPPAQADLIAAAESSSGEEEEPPEDNAPGRGGGRLVWGGILLIAVAGVAGWLLLRRREP